MHSAGKAVISATRFLRPVGGGSQSSLVEASDGHIYVIKSIENTQGANVLCNEVLGTELYRALRLPAPDWMPVQVSLAFAKDNPGCWIAAEGEYRFPTGLCFGSRLVGGRAGQVLEMLPGRYLERVQNLTDFWRAWITDACADHMDQRQAVFKTSEAGTLVAHFIDHGHMFGGPNGNLTGRTRLPVYVDRRVYGAPTALEIMHLVQRSTMLDSDQLLHRIETMPDYWKTGSAMRNFKMCIERLSTAQFLEETLNKAISEFLSQAENERTRRNIERTSPLPLLRNRVSGGRIGRRAFA